MRQSHSIAERSHELQEVVERKDDHPTHKTFRMPLQAARLQAREFLNEGQGRGYMTIIENWRQLTDGQIEFTMRRLPTAD